MTSRPQRSKRAKHRVGKHRTFQNRRKLLENHMVYIYVRSVPMRRFLLNRRHDVNGISGTGIVAEGIEFSNGRCAMTWYGNVQSVTVYDRMRDLMKIHCHGDATSIEWIDEEHRERRYAAEGETSL